MENFEKIYKQEKNEHTAFILILGEISKKLSEIIALLSTNKEMFGLQKKENIEPKSKKYYIPLTSEDYD